MLRLLFCLLLILTPIDVTGKMCKDWPCTFRIVSLGPAITEDLYLLGLGDRIVGVTTYCVRPQEAKKKEKVGTVMEIDVEKIITLRPDLVIGTPLTDKRQLEKLKNLGINVVVFPLARDFSGICSQFLELGRMLGKEKKAKKIVKMAQERVNRVRGKIKMLPKVSVFVQVGSKPLFTIGGDSFINDYIEMAGGINIAKDCNLGFYNREEVLRKDPDVILIVGMGILGEREKAIWQRYKSLRAVRNNRVYILDSYKMCSPTPITFAQMLEELVGILHKKNGVGEKQI